MNNKNYNKLIGKLTKVRHALGNNKNKDYAGEQDRLANFKRLSEVANIENVDVRQSGFDYAMFMALMKYDRIMNLINMGNSPNNESIDDSFKDLLNYIELAYGLYVEGEV